jgi:arsenate reductase
MHPRQLMRTKESVYLDLNLADTDLTEDDLINAMITYPILIERPIAIKNANAVIGRPPENVLALL